MCHDRHINYCLERIKLLLKYQVKVYLVFDGGVLPSKKVTEDERMQRRKENLEKGKALLSEGNVTQARRYLAKAVDITPTHARMLMLAVKGMKNVRYVVSPYEADAQLRYLCDKGHIDAVITEDSDLLVYGCRRVLFKLDATGNVEQIMSQDALAYLRFKSTELDLFQQMCVMSGCDYVKSISGIGVKKAHNLLLTHKDWRRAVRKIRHDGKMKVPRQYDKDVERALLTFKYQTVFDPVKRCATSLSPLSYAMRNDFSRYESFLGKIRNDALAQGIADGILDPDSCEPLPTDPSVITRTSSAAATLSTLRSKERKSKSSKHSAVKSQSLLTYLSRIPKPNLEETVNKEGDVAPSSSSSALNGETASRPLSPTASPEPEHVPTAASFLRGHSTVIMEPILNEPHSEDDENTPFLLAQTDHHPQPHAPLDAGEVGMGNSCSSAPLPDLRSSLHCSDLLNTSSSGSTVHGQPTPVRSKYFASSSITVEAEHIVVAAEKVVSSESGKEEEEAFLATSTSSTSQASPTSPIAVTRCGGGTARTPQSRLSVVRRLLLQKKKKKKKKKDGHLKTKRLRPSPTENPMSHGATGTTSSTLALQMVDHGPPVENDLGSKKVKGVRLEDNNTEEVRDLSGANVEVAAPDVSTLFSRFARR